MDRLEAFRDWWLAARTLAVPFERPVMVDGNIWGAVLYRAAPWQVQLFILKPESVVPEHRHPNVDSFEIYLSGDIEFSLEGQVLTPAAAEADFSGGHPYFGQCVRVAPNAWHGAKCGTRGGVFLSLQHWLNLVPPSNVGDDWEHKDGETRRNYGAAKVP